MKMKPKLTTLPRPDDEVSIQMTNVLSNIFASRMKSQVYHWNFVGSNFYGAHQLLEEVYKKWDDYIDEVAERLRTIGSRPPLKFKRN